MSEQSFHFYEPKLGHHLPHNPFKSIIAPRPIGWIGSKSADGIANLAPYSFFNAFCDEPPIIGFASSGYKDSVRNIEQTKEFSWNLVTRSLASQMNQSCASVEPQIDEFELCSLETAPSNIIDVPRVAASPV